jgi:hypothetical protein
MFPASIPGPPADIGQGGCMKLTLQRRSILAALVLFAAVTAVRGGEKGNGPGGSDPGGSVIPFKEARLYIEFNSTANDLGFHTSLDAEDWSDLRIVRPDGKTVFQVKGKGAFGTLGMTELFFEGAEPSLDEFPLDELLALFPEGTYRFLGRTVNGDVLDSNWNFTHLYPDGPVVHSPVEGSVVDPSNLVVDWDPVTSPAGIRILEYEVIIGALDPVMKSSLRVPAGVTSLKIPREMLLPGTDYEFEVVAVEVNRSQTLTTSFFSTP